MTEWEPATEAEADMRDALRANDQELYFQILARTELLLHNKHFRETTLLTEPEFKLIPIVAVAMNDQQPRQPSYPKKS